MAEDAGDVAFVKQSTPGDVTAEDPKYGSVTDYQLLCQDGSTKGKLFKHNPFISNLQPAIYWIYHFARIQIVVARLEGRKADQGFEG